MVKVHFPREKISIEIPAGTRLIECIRQAGLALETPCNCVGICGKCRVIAQGELSSPGSEEIRFITNPGERIACLTIVQGETWVELPQKESGLKTINKGLAVEVGLDCAVKIVKLPVPSKEAQPYLEKFPYRVESPEVFRQAGEVEQVLKRGAGSGGIFGVVSGNELIDFCTEIPQILGVAVDIGTTGLSAYLLDLRSGEILNKVSSLNPQTRYGGDVLSRITFCQENSDGPAILRDAVIGEINRMINELTGNPELLGRIYRVVIAGNTTMQHFALGVYPGSMAKAPFRPVFLERVDLKAAETGLRINPRGRVILLPSVSGYVGADIVAGVAATDFDQKQHRAVFIDIGTNGEIVANLDGRLLATSTAAGPALEGMNISWGCRAEAGAIDTFTIDEDYNISFTTIGGAPPKGFCGSGLIDLTAALVTANIVLSSGRLNPIADPRVSDRIRDKKFYINDEIYVSQTDLRQIQLAKGAMAAGVVMLLAEADMPFETVEEVVIAGAFGYHVNPESIKRIGLIPPNFSGIITFAGNSSVEGARLALINKGMQERMDSLYKSLEVVELSTSPKFQDYFVKSLTF